MSSSELFDRYDKVVLTEPTFPPLMEIRAALRKAAIREASVGEVTVKITEYEDELTAPVGSPDRIVTCGEQFVCQSWIPEGTYRLIKKEE